MLFSMAPLHLLGHNDQKWGEIWLFIMWCPWHKCWHQMVPMALKMTSFYSLCQDELQLGHIMPFALVAVLCDADGIINGTISFLMSKWLKLGATLLFSPCATIGIVISSMWCQWHCQLHHCICQVNMIETRCNMTFLVMSCHWHQCWNHMMPSALSKVPLHSLHQEIQN